MTQPFSSEQESAPSSARAGFWAVLLLVVIAGVILYFLYGSHVNPLLYLEPAR